MNNMYTETLKESMIKKMTGPGARSATALSEEVGIPQSTLSRWLRNYGTLSVLEDGMSSTKRPQNWSTEEKMKAVLAYEAMDEEERGTYLRKKGLYSVDIKRWRAEMLAGLDKKPNKKDPKDRRIRDLEGELRRKEKALAETAALLVLKKKAQAIWGENGEGK